MVEEIGSFVRYMHEVKHTSQNTEVSYQRDLLKLSAFLEQQGITDVKKVTKTSLNSYILLLEQEGKATTTISRSIASMKAFFHYEFKEGNVKRDPAELLHAPKIEKKMPEILSVSEMSSLLNQPDGKTPKELRDKAMLELLYATGIRVTELINLKLLDINMQLGYICCDDGHKTRMVPFGKVAKNALAEYLEKGRGYLVKDETQERLFTNCSGKAMSRQGFWKLIKYYGSKAGIEMDITPHTLRHTFAAHLIENGADIHAVQEMLGHSDIATTQMYAVYGTKNMRDTYEGAHPRR